MSFSSPQDIKRIANDCGYVERREEASHTLFFKKSVFEGNKYPTLINIFYTTRGVMTKLSHPSSGYNQLWRSSAYDSEETLKAIFDNPRSHTGKGYRSADKAKRGCAKCGMERQKSEFSKTQWRKNVGESKCVACIKNGKCEGKKKDVHTHVSSMPSSNLPILFLGCDQWFVDTCGDAIKNNCMIVASDTLIGDSSQAQISSVSQKFCGVITTDDWFDVDVEYQPIANSIFRTLKEMYHSGGSVLIVATMGIFSVPQQISAMFEFVSPWTYNAYTKMYVTTTTLGEEILGDAFPMDHVYTKANFIGALKEDCLFEEYIHAEDYEDDSDYDEVPSPNQDSPIVRHCGLNGGKIFYFGFVNNLDVSYGDIFLKLMHPSTSVAPQGNPQAGIRAVTAEAEINYEYIPCDAEGCSRFGATIRCSSCKMAFYCSELCQRRHEPAHMDDCRLSASIFAMHPNPNPPRELLHGRAMAAHLAGRRDFQGMLLQAEYWQYEENWEAAFEAYQSIFNEMINRSPPEQRQVMMGICRCLYEIGRFEHAIQIGQSAIEMNRHFQKVHKYVALAQKAKGEHSDAVATITRAVLYEAPWDEENIKANKALLLNLQN